MAHPVQYYRHKIIDSTSMTIADVESYPVALYEAQQASFSQITKDQGIQSVVLSLQILTLLVSL